MKPVRCSSTMSSREPSSKASSILAAPCHTIMAVGVEHAPWLSQDISPVGVTMIRSLLDGVDPGHNFNPGKIV